MTTDRFQRTIADALLAVGFVKTGKLHVMDRSDVATLVDFQRGFGQQRFANVGFWIHALPGQVPSKVEHCHLYCRLESLVPELRYEVLTAGDRTDPENEPALSRLAEQSGTIAVALVSASSVSFLRGEVTRDAFRGLVTKEARAFLAAEDRF